jgi:hypothetical protein
MRVDERTRHYIARRTANGKSKKEVIRCLKRYVAREVYRELIPAASPPPMGSCTSPGSSPRTTSLEIKGRRYIARQIYRVLLSSVAARTSPIGTTNRVAGVDIA